MRALTDCILYGICDFGYIAAAEAPALVREMVQSGVDIIQLRAKDTELSEIADIARILHPITKAAKIPFILNDHPELAAELNLEGVHLGQDDMPTEKARTVLRPGQILGRSTHSLEQVQQAAAEGADYLGFGPLFATPTKPTYTPIGLDDIARAQTLAQRPLFCIGGIKRENLPAIVCAGAQRVVIVSGIILASDRVQYIKEVKEKLPS